MKISDTATLEWKHYQHPREGTLEVKPLARGRADGVNYNLTYTRYGEGAETFATPRHRHTFEQVRFPTAGSLNYGPGREIPEGWLGYFPAGVSYGPQRVEGGTILLLQFGEDYLTSAQYRETHAALEALGSFRGGDFVDRDPHTGAERVRDAVAAVWEEALGRPMVYPAPRYPEPVLMDPSAFDWLAAGTDPGIETKLLGSFTERDVRLEMVRWIASGTVGLDPDRTQILWTVSGGVVLDGKELGAATAVLCETGEEAAIGGTAGGEALVITLPRARPGAV